MKNCKLPRLIASAIALLVLLIVGLGLFSRYHLTSIRGDTDELVGDQVPSLVTITRIRALSKDLVIDTLLYLSTDEPKLRAELKARHEKAQTAIAESNEFFQKNCVTDQADQELFDKVIGTQKPFLEARAKAVELADAGNSAEAISHVYARVMPAYEAYNAAIEQSAGLQIKAAQEAGAAVLGSVIASVNAITAGTVAALILGTGSGLLVIRLVRKRISDITQSLSEGAAQVNASAQQVAGASESLAQGASEQAASLEETSASLEEISSTTRRNAENADHAKAGAAKARAAAEAGAQDMRAMSVAMDEIKGSSDNIAKIIKTIDEIAFQTNILALNAAVEAARAGAAGAGFAVVADEVRSLAQRSAVAAKETAEKIEDSIRKSGQGVALSQKVAASLQAILDHSREVDSLVAEIAQASAEQSTGLSQVVTAVSQMDKVTQANAASAEEGSSAAQQLTAQSGTLDRLVGELQAFTGAKARTQT